MSAVYDRSDQVRIRNGTDKAIKGRWNGTDFVWKPGQHLDVPLVVAHHIFGFGGDEKTELDALTRLGWARTTDDIENARARMALVSFSDCPALVEQETGGDVRPLGAPSGDSARRIQPPPGDEPTEEGDTL